MSLSCNPNQKASCVSKVPIFNHLTAEEMQKIVEKAVMQHFKPGEFLYKPHKEDSSLYIIHTGVVRIYHLHPSGKEQLIRHLQAGDFTGEWKIFSQSFGHNEYAEAIEETEVCVLSQTVMQELLTHYPAVSLKLLQEMSRRLAQSEQQTTKIGIAQVGSRLALYLVNLVREEEQQKNRASIILPMSRKEIAAYLGTTPETISRRFKKLEKEGLILQHSERSIELLDLARLSSYE